MISQLNVTIDDPDLCLWFIRKQKFRSNLHHYDSVIINWILFSKFCIIFGMAFLFHHMKKKHANGLFPFLGELSSEKLLSLTIWFAPWLWHYFVREPMILSCFSRSSYMFYLHIRCFSSSGWGRIMKEAWGVWSLFMPCTHTSISIFHWLLAPVKNYPLQLHSCGQTVSSYRQADPHSSMH